MTRLAAFASLALSTVMLLGGCSSYSSAASKHRELRTFVLDARTFEAIEIETGKGRIDIAPHGTDLPRWALAALNNDAEVIADRSHADEASAFIIAVVQSDRKARVTGATLEPRVEDRVLRLEASWPFAISDDKGDGVEYAIRVPAVHALALKNAFGDIKVHDATGVCTIDSGFGDIELTAQHAPVDAGTGFGDIEVGFMGPHAERSALKTGFGDIEATGVAGALRADTGFGDIRLTLTDDNEGPIDADSGFGDVRIEAGPAFAQRVRTASGFGDAKVVSKQGTDTPKTSRATTGFGDAVVTIRER